MENNPCPRSECLKSDFGWKNIDKVIEMRDEIDQKKIIVANLQTGQKINIL